MPIMLIILETGFKTQNRNGVLRLTTVGLTLEDRKSYLSFVVASACVPVSVMCSIVL